MESNRIFQNGMNSDTSKLYQQPNTYVKALNYRPVSDSGSSNGSLVNIRGNECALTFPIVRGVYKLQFKYHEEGNFTGVINITVNGQTTSNITIDSGTKTSEVGVFLTSLTNCYNNPNSVNPTFAVAWDDEFLVIYQNPKYEGCSITESTEPIITVNTVSGTPELLFVQSSGVQTSTQQPYVPTLQGEKLVVIGSTFINEDNYIFTCPENNPNETGQIWMLNYDELTGVNTLLLIYNGLLNFTIDHPIPPSACIGRYELESLQRVYWTDFFNPVRGMNVKDQHAMVLTASTINLTPSVKLSVPILTNIFPGLAQNPLNTNTTYQCAYRLVKNNGAVTNYSMASNIVYPIMFNTNDYTVPAQKFASLRGFVGSINKALEFTVDGIDTSFDVIEFVIVERVQPNKDLYFVYKFDEQIISGNETITTLFTNPTDKEEITLEEFLLENSAFTHCKTIDSKDNRLFFGNVKDDLNTYLDTYDTRAYRFPYNDINLRILKYDTDNTVSQFPITNPSSYDNINEEWDSIAPFNLGFNTGEEARYEPNKYRIGSSILGGSGPNISYKFGAKLLHSDRSVVSPTSASAGTSNAGTNEDTGTSPNKFGFRFPGNNGSNTGINPYFNGAPYQEYPVNNLISSMGLEYFGGTYKSYQHNEIYRFGIVFYSKSGSVSFVKWIGDIKFPDYNDVPAPGLEGIANDGSICPDFRSVFQVGGEAYNVVPYVQFEVNIPPGLADLIYGYEIVRCERTSADMYIKDRGHILPCADRVAENMQTSGAALSVNPTIFTFDGYNSITDGYGGQSSNLDITNDKIKFTEVFGLTHSAVLNTDTGVIPFDEFHKLYKYYTYVNGYVKNNSNSLTFKLGVEDYISQSGNNGTFFNYKTWGTSPNDWSTLGSPTIYMTISSPLPPTMGTLLDATTATFNQLFGIVYTPIRLTTQYGGRKYINRTTSKYISTGSFYPIYDDVNNNITASGVKTIDTFGGDMYHSIVDIHKNIRNWGTNGSIGATTKKQSIINFFATQSIYNIDLRDGNHANRNLNLNAQFADFDEQFGYNYTYSYPNTVKEFYPKPAFFNDTAEWNNRVYWSNVKINGETSDSWTSVPTLNYYDVEGAYGGINALQILNNNMYVLQDRAFGYLYINPITTISGSNGLPVTLGKGNTVEKHEYLSIDAGTKHQWSVYRSNSALTFIDSRHKKVYLFNGQALLPISDVKGQRGFVNKVLHDDLLTTDNPVKYAGVLTTYDHVNNEFLYTFRNYYKNKDGADPSVSTDEYTKESYTLVYSDLINAFSSYYSFTPYIYINNRNKLYSLPDRITSTNKIWMHNIGEYCKFYGGIYPSKLRVNINDNPLHTKVFDNLSWITESIKENVKYKDDNNDYYITSDDVPHLNDTIKNIRCYNEYQNTDWITLNPSITGPITNLRKSEQGWNISVPRNKVNYDSTNINTKSIFDPTILTKTTFGDRMRDKNMIVDLNYDNSINNRFVIHNLKCAYRISDR